MKPVPISYVEGWLAFYQHRNLEDNPYFGIGFDVGQSWNWANGWHDCASGIELCKLEVTP